MKLYIFNPDTDMALASQEENYMAPALIRCMAEDMAAFPVWYATDSSLVLAPSAYNIDFLKQMQTLFPLDVQIVTEVELPEYAHVQPLPWGWNMALCRRLFKGGIFAGRLPAAGWLEAYRQWASRRNAVDVLQSLVGSDGIKDCQGSSLWLTDIEACHNAALAMHGHCVFKAPWSGSGKGLLWCRDGFAFSARKWCERVLREQQGIVAEPIYNKVLDFAMEFYSSGQGEVAFRGYSLFETNSRGAYQRNLLLPASAIEDRIAGFVSLLTLIRVRERLQEKLCQLYGSVYEGFLGVDMMVCRDMQGSFFVHPCVEINLRMNMGIVSLIFFERFMHPSSTGYFSVSYYASNEELQREHASDQHMHPLVVSNCRLVSGYLPLVPVTPRSRYRAYVVAATPSPAPTE